MNLPLVPTTEPPDASAETQLVLTFLESVGKRQDAEFYLKLFRQVPKPSFALVTINSVLLSEAMGLLVDGLQFLSRLDLFPVLVCGLDEPQSPNSAIDEQALGEFERELEHRGLTLVLHSSTTPDLTTKIARDIEKERTVCVDFSNDASPPGFEALAGLAVALRSRKLVFLRPRGGLGPKGVGQVSLSPSHVLPTDDNGIGVINLRTDHTPLLMSGLLDADEQALLAQVAAIHQHAPNLVTSITSPLDLLRELFTVRGAGTLIKTGSTIHRTTSYVYLDVTRLQSLIETSFGRQLKPGFLQRPPLNVYFEEGYRGAAIVQPGVDPGSAYLTKFAVARGAQGEGLGRELWAAVIRDFPVLYWRARVQNPIAAWYASQCDGMHRVGDWWIYWRGVPFERVPALCNDALVRPYDLI